MKRITSAISFGIFSLLFTLAPAAASAQGSQVSEGLKQAGGKARLDTSSSLIDIIGNVIDVLLGLSGVLLLLVLIYSGFLYLTALGEAAKVEKAKNMILYSVIGLVIIALSYTISAFVIDSLTGTLSGATPQAGAGADGSAEGFGDNF